jgi:hypothetical protein
MMNCNNPKVIFKKLIELIDSSQIEFGFSFNMEDEKLPEIFIFGIHTPSRSMNEEFLMDIIINNFKYNESHLLPVCFPIIYIPFVYLRKELINKLNPDKFELIEKGSIIKTCEYLTIDFFAKNYDKKICNFLIKNNIVSKEHT